MKTRYLAILATLAFLGFSVPAAAHDCIRHADQNHKHCVSDPAPSGGGKALLFVIHESELQTCGGVTDPTGDSFGQVSWSGNVLWDPEFIHVHNKVQLENVEPITAPGYQIFGNNDIACGISSGDVALCGGGDDHLCPPMLITVKQNRQGRTSGALRLPGCKPDEPTTVWVTVTVDNSAKILRSTPVTVVLPPNEVGTGGACPE